MKTLLTFIFLTISLFGFSQIKYPIQTIYKGDSVVILSVKQSIEINKVIEKQKKIIREQNKKIVALNKRWMIPITSIIYCSFDKKNIVFFSGHPY